MRCCTERNIQKAIVPAITGEITQLETMEVTALQSTASTEMPTAAKPLMAPTIEWVVDTGQPRILAINNHVPAANSAEGMPYTNSSGVSVSMWGSTRPLRLVEVPAAAARSAPRNAELTA